MMALADILHIAPFENPFNNKVGFGIVVDLLKVHIPEDALRKDGFWLAVHTAKIVKSSFNCMVSFSSDLDEYVSETDLIYSVLFLSLAN